MTKCSKCGLEVSGCQTALHCGRCGTTTPCGEPIVATKRGTVGTQLLSVIPSILKKEGCGCEELAHYWDRKGDQWCVDNRDVIVDKLLERAHKRFGSFLPFARHVISSWVDQAIGQALQPIESDGRWFVAVTTAPRKSPTLAACVNSLRFAGWEPRVFAEPGSPQADCETYENEQVLGVWHNWLHSAKTALQSDAEWIFTVQDDIVIHPEAKAFTEEVMQPKFGFLSLYTPKHYSVKDVPKRHRKKRKPVWFPIGVRRVRTKSLWGACALVWHRDVLQQVVDHKIASRWKGAGPSRNKEESVSEFRTRRAAWYANKEKKPYTIANSDTAIGKIVNDIRKPMFFVDPSPASHIAEFSTIKHGGNGGKRNCIRCANHLQSLYDQVFPDKP